MTNDLAKTIAAACLEAIQSRPDTPTVDELAEVVRPMLEAHAEPPSLAPADLYAAAARDLYGVDPADWMRDAKKRGEAIKNDPSTQELPWDKLRDPITDGPEHDAQNSVCPHGDCRGDLMFRCWDGIWRCISCGGPANPTDEAW